MRHLDLLMMLTTMVLPVPVRWRRAIWNGWVRATPWITTRRRAKEFADAAATAEAKRSRTPRRSTAES